MRSARDSGRRPSGLRRAAAQGEARQNGAEGNRPDCRCKASSKGCRGSLPTDPNTIPQTSWWKITGAVIGAAIIIFMTWNGSLFG